MHLKREIHTYIRILLGDIRSTLVDNQSFGLTVIQYNSKKYKSETYITLGKDGCLKCRPVSTRQACKAEAIAFIWPTAIMGKSDKI